MDQSNARHLLDYFDKRATLYLTAERVTDPAVPEPDRREARRDLAALIDLYHQLYQDAQGRPFHVPGWVLDALLDTGPLVPEAGP